MTQERIVSTLHKAIQAVADVAAKPERRPVDGPVPASTQSVQASDEISVDAPPAVGHHAGHEPVAQPPRIDALTLGLPPPTTGPLPVTTLAVAIALQVIADRLIKPSADPPDTRPATTDQTVTTTAIDVQSTGEVREIQFVKGVPKTTNIIATDERPRHHLDTVGNEHSSETLAPPEHGLAQPRPSDLSTAASRSAETDAPHHSEPAVIASMEILLPSGSHDLPQHVGILPSAILNAAMLPGWPPPRALEGLQAQVLDNPDEALARREAAIAALLEALGIEPGSPLYTKNNGKSAWRWLRRISVVLAGIVTVVTTLASEIAEMRDEEDEIADARLSGRRGGKPSKRIYLE